MVLCILTHVDADAVVAATLYLACRGISLRDAEVKFITPRDLPKALFECIDKCSSVAIMDLGINAATLEGILKAISELRSKGTEIEWYDHHVWDTEWIEKVMNMGVKLFIDRSTCAAGLVSRALCRDEECKYLAEVACSVDLWKFDLWEAPFLYRVVEWYASKGLWKELVAKFIEYGCNVKRIIERERKTIEELVDIELSAISKALSKVLVIEIGSAKICLYAKDESEKSVSTSLLGNAMINRNGCSIAAVIRRDLKSISFRSSVCDVRELAKHLGGGGHPRAAGAPLSMNSIVRATLLILAKIGAKSIYKSIVHRIVAAKLAKAADVIKHCCWVK